MIVSIAENGVTSITGYLISHIVNQIAIYLEADFKLDIPSALNVIYTSGTYQILSEEDSELYVQSPVMYMSGLEENILRNN